MTSCPHTTSPKRLAPQAAWAWIQQHDPLILDVRRAEAFGANPQGLPGALAITLEAERQSIPDVPPERPILVYCLCRGEASSLRLGLCLQQAGHHNVALLRGGLPAWTEAGLPLAPLHTAPAELNWRKVEHHVASGDALVAEQVFLDAQESAIRRDIAVVFVDMVDSTGLMLSNPPDVTLELFQQFMQIVVDTTVRHCGDVHDFAGDGAMLYFSGVGEALPAAFELRDALLHAHTANPALPLARIAVTTGPVIIGYVGTQLRRSPAFIGPCVTAAARILHHSRPGGLVATAQVLAQARDSAPQLAHQLQAQSAPQALKGWSCPVQLFHST